MRGWKTGEPKDKRRAYRIRSEGVHGVGFWSASEALWMVEWDEPPFRSCRSEVAWNQEWQYSLKASLEPAPHPAIARIDEALRQHLIAFDPPEADRPVRPLTFAEGADIASIIERLTASRLNLVKAGPS